MIKHLVAFRFHDDVSASDRDDLLAEMRGFPERFKAMRAWTMGTNFSTRDDRFSHAFVVEFESAAALDDYLNSEAHERFVADRFRPLIAERAIVSYEF